MSRAAARSAWGAWVGFESCPGLLDRLVEGFPGPWTPLASVPVPVAVPASGPPGDGSRAEGRRGRPTEVRSPAGRADAAETRGRQASGTDAAEARGGHGP
ncbi:hypothetical protein, partial [Microbispora sp. ATCC PTA-5024]|uniref:hypothetical protein n=1 Tax=Microbispora sp. ATCC PTA-5024 TaxID=316330 RepID=UPI00055F2F60